MHTRTESSPLDDEPICGFDRHLFLNKFPMLAPAIATIIDSLYGVKKHDAIDLFLLSFCRLFERGVSEDRDEIVSYLMTAKIINRMLEAGHTITIGKNSRSLATLFHAATREAGDMAPVFRQAVASMYARRYAVN